MKPSPTPKRSPRTRREQGIALVTVLAILTLTAVLVMAFFAVSRSELASSTVYHRGVEAANLSKAAVDMVIHQIRSATETPGVAWASQPGMVRTWETGSGVGQRCYKLYSDDDMVITEAGVFDDVKEVARWKNDVRFVDLNAPVIRTYDGKPDQRFYPIIDPQAAYGGPGREVEGFSVDFAAVGASKADRTLPMPVKWIYQLQDGTLGTLGGTGTKGPFQALKINGTALGGSLQPSASNPIVARFAFWADDETAKINVNTAAGGVAWDTPRAGGESDRQYGRFQPVANEFQRYPGHPATVSMIHVLFPGVALPGSSRYDRKSAELFYALVPRVQSGGSRGGGYAGTDNRYGLILPIQPDQDRLYATIDEFIFRAPLAGAADGKTSPNFKRLDQPRVGEWPELRPQDLSRFQFFLTAASKAPEVTIFNTPRISVWPSYYGDPTSSGDTTYFTSYDRRLRFCAEVGKGDVADPKAPKDASGKSPAMYHFQRRNAASITKDYTDIPRNKQLYSYLQTLMSSTVPGIDTSDGVANFDSFKGKYGNQNRDQIITEIFDYIRSVNLYDDLLMKQHKVALANIPRAPIAFRSQKYYGYYPPGGPNEGRHPSFTPGRLSVYNPPDLVSGHAASIGSDTLSGHGQVAPIQIGDTKGFGRFYGFKEMGIAILCCAQDNGRPGGVSRKAVGVRNQGSTNETWETTGKKFYTGADPGSDYSNVPPLSATTPQHVFDKYRLGNVDRDGEPGVKLTVADLSSPTVRVPSLPAMSGLDFYNYVIKEENWNRTLLTDTPLVDGETRVQAILLMSLFCPSKGWTLINPDFRLSVEVLQDFGLETQPPLDKISSVMGFPSGVRVIRSPHASFSRVWGGRDQGGVLEPRMLFMGHSKIPNAAPDGLNYGLVPRYAPETASLVEGGDSWTYDDPNRTWFYRQEQPFQIDESVPGSFESVEAAKSGLVYPWVGRPITIPGTKEKDANGIAIPAPFMTLLGGHMVFRIYPDGGARTDGADPNSGRLDIENDALSYSQQIDVQFRSATIPLPILAGAADGHRIEGPAAGQWKAIEATQARPKQYWSWNREGAFKRVSPTETPNPIPLEKADGDEWKKLGRMGMVMGWQNDNLFDPAGEPGFWAYPGHSLVRSCDVTRSYVIRSGDDRLACARREITNADGIFEEHPKYGDGSVMIASNFTDGWDNGGYGRDGNPTTGNGAKKPKSFTPDANPPDVHKPMLPDTFEVNMDRWGDWDNGVAGELDGPFINKPDEGNAMGVAYDDYEPKPWVTNSRKRAFIPYFTEPWKQESAGPGLWSPNRIMPGPGMFGSLPTGVYAKNGGSPQPWQTLLFRRIGGSTSQSANGQSPRTLDIHPGWQHPRDHYILDFFWMPVVEPYSISEPLATAGKINMNYAIQPFDYIKRKSSLLGVFASEELLTVPNRLATTPTTNGYKTGEGWGTGYERVTDTGGSLRTVSLRTWIGLDETLRQFDQVFGAPNGRGRPQIFRTASQICEQWLVPGQPVLGAPYGPTRGMKLEDVSQWYNPDKNDVAGQRSFGLVGDNARERPYTNLVARLTTKSNTYNVHYRAQVIRQSPLSPVNPGMRRTDAEFAIFDSSVDKMVGEYRGSSIVERYIDPNDTRIPDYAARSGGSLDLGRPPATMETLDKFYRFRVVSEKRFAP